MRAHRPIAAAAALFVAILPARADQILAQPRINASNQIVLPGGPTLGLWSGGKYTSQPDVLQIKGTGSTGDVSGMSVTAGGSTNTLAVWVPLFAPLASPAFTGSATFSSRPTFAGATPWDSANLDPTTKLNLSGGGPTGQVYFQDSVGGTIASRSGDGSYLQVRSKTSDGTSAAGMTFHRPGVYATWFGLDTDNEFRRGGWSDGTASYKFWTEKNFDPTKKVSADVSQSFTRAQQSQARQNIGAGPLLYGQVNTTTALDATYLNKTVWTSGNAITITLPPANVAVSGDEILFTNFSNGSVTIVPASNGGLIYSLAGTGVGSYNLGPGQSATFQTDGTNWVVKNRAVAPERTLNVDAAQGFTSAQQDMARYNIGGPVPSSPSGSFTIGTIDIDRPFFAAATSTITLPNGGAGWRTGTISNTSTQSALVTLAVPSGATLDGVTNGTTVLYPYQRARIIQTGATAYVTDWIDRSPVVASSSITTAAASANFSLPVGYSSFRVALTNVRPGTAGSSFYARFSPDGVTFNAGATDYNRSVLETTTTTAAAGGAQSYIEIATPLGSVGIQVADLTVSPGGTNAFAALTSRAQFFDNAGVYAQYMSSGILSGIAAGRVAALQLGFGTGTGTFVVSIRGVP